MPKSRTQIACSKEPSRKPRVTSNQDVVIGLLTRPDGDPAAVKAEVDRVRSLGIAALRARWRVMFGGAPPPGLTKDIIRRVIAHRIQEDAFGGLDRDTIKLLDRLARGEKTRTELNRRLKPGTILFREYQGKRHTVTVVPEGLLWEGTTYTSLSTIARAITGTAWNGPRFFGLRAVGEKPVRSPLRHPCRSASRPNAAELRSVPARNPARRQASPWTNLPRSSSGVQSTRANRPSITSISSSTHSTPSARPVRRI